MQNLFNRQGLNKLIRKVDTLVWDLSSGKLGIQLLEGIATLETTGEGAAQTFNVSVNPLDVFGHRIPAYAVNTPNADIELGDIIVGSNDVLGWVVKKNNASLEILKKDGQITRYSAVKTQIFGTNGYMVVKNLFSLLGQEGATGLQGTLMPLMLMGNDSGLDIESILPFLLLQGQSSQPGGFNVQALLPMLLLKGGLGSSKKDLLPLLFMSGGLNGGSAAGGLSSLLPLLVLGGFGDEDAVTSERGHQSRLSSNGTPPLTRTR
jgi:hypothetical protein